jgi:hypothetical protein
LKGEGRAFTGSSLLPTTMKIKITRNVRTKDYAHYPSQILIDHPDEKRLLDEGCAIPVPEEPENATLPKAEARKSK